MTRNIKVPAWTMVLLSLMDKIKGRMNTSFGDIEARISTIIEAHGVAKLITMT